MADYKIITTKSLDELYAHFQKWRDMNESLQLPISYNPKWLLAWLESYNDVTIEIDVTFIYNDSQLLAVIPLMIRIENEMRILKFLSDSCSDYLGIPFRNEIMYDLSEIVKKRFDELDFSYFCFSNIHEHDKSFPIIIYALTNFGIKLQIEHTEKSLSIYLDSTFKNKFISTIASRQFKRKLFDINQLGKIQFKVIHSANEGLLSEIIQIHIGKWETNKVYPQFSDSRRKEFLKKIIDYFSENDEFTVFGLYLNETLIAYRLGCIYNSVYFDWNTSFDTKYEKHSPGTVLLIMLIKHLQSIGVEKFDFMNGNEEYKYLWKTNMTKVYKITGANNHKKQNNFEPVSTPKLKDIKSKKCIILDIHGIMYKGDIPIIPTIEGTKILLSMGIKIGIHTNTSTISVTDLYNKFLSSGLLIDEKYIMTSAIAIKDYLLKEGYNKCYLIGGKPELPSLLKAHNIKMVQNPKEAQAVVVGFSIEFYYTQLTDAYEAIQNGADFVCADADLLYASENKNLPGLGWIVSSISSVCNKKPFIVGKPNDFALKLLMQKMEVKPSETIFIGDSLESDIMAGKNAGVTTCLHLGGVSKMNDVTKLPPSLRPDYIISSFDEILKVFTEN